MATKIELISNALILIGDLPITSLDGNTRAQTVANNLYDNIVISPGVVIPVGSNNSSNPKHRLI